MFRDMLAIYIFLKACAPMMLDARSNKFAKLIITLIVSSILQGSFVFASVPETHQLQHPHHSHLNITFLEARGEESLAEQYNSSRSPPPGYEEWLTFAKHHKCHLGPYAQIDQDLQAFTAIVDGKKAGITQEQITEASKLPRTIKFSIRDGKMHAEGSEWWIGKMLKSAESFQEFLPDMDFVVNGLDEPLVLPGKDDDIDARYQGNQCQNASASFIKHRHLHGDFNNRPEGVEYFPTKTLLPLFSQSKIRGCHADITFPTHYNVDEVMVSDENLPSWEERIDTLFFRGSTTGGVYKESKDYRIAHRQRLVELARGKPHMDIAFSNFIQCTDPAVCEEMEKHYGKAAHVHQMENFKHKYLMSIDGNTFVSRLPRFLSSGSLIFRAGLYSEWFDEWLIAGEHFLQIDLDYSNLHASLQWALDHDDEASLIGKNAQHFARTRLRNEDQQCYMYRLLLEYHNMLTQDGEMTS